MCNHDTYQSNSAKPEIIHNRGANCAETSLNRPTATSLSLADAELARLTEGMIISGGALPRRITLRNCQL